MRPRFHPWVGKIHWRREWQPTPVYLPRDFHGKRSLKGCSPWVCKRVRHNWATNTHILLKYSFPLWFITGYWIYFSMLYTVETCLFVLYVIVCIYHPQTSKTSLPCSAFLFRKVSKILPCPRTCNWYIVGLGYEPIFGWLKSPHIYNDGISRVF